MTSKKAVYSVWNAKFNDENVLPGHHKFGSV